MVRRRVAMFLRDVGVVLSRICRFVLERLKDQVEGDGNQRADQRPDPVNPVLAFKYTSDNARAETTGWIQRSKHEMLAAILSQSVYIREGLDSYPPVH
jgi:hypothetical protein